MSHPASAGAGRDGSRLRDYVQHKADCESWPRTSFKCSGCGYVTVDPKALKSCKGYCMNGRPFSDPDHCRSAFPCPQCERLHYWGGNAPVTRPCTCGLDAILAVPDPLASEPCPPDFCPDCSARMVTTGGCSRCGFVRHQAVDPLASETGQGFQCERCGGTGRQAAGLYRLATRKYDSMAGVCDDCNGSGRLSSAPLASSSAPQEEKSKKI